MFCRLSPRFDSDPAGTVPSNSWEGPQNWPDVTITSGNADVVARLKTESRVPLRSHASLALNRSLLATGLVGRV